MLTAKLLTAVLPVLLMVSVALPPGVMLRVLLLADSVVLVAELEVGQPVKLITLLINKMALTIRRINPPLNL
jgi:hypothetical protein